jgi:hypothetical protein
MNFSPLKRYRVNSLGKERQGRKGRQGEKSERRFPPIRTSGRQGRQGGNIYPNAQCPMPHAQLRITN